MSEINPCPNPKCGWIGLQRPPLLHSGYRDGFGYYVSCLCEMHGPFTPTEAAAIASWNSISMGWRKPETAPKDGTLIQAVIINAIGQTLTTHILWRSGWRHSMFSEVIQHIEVLAWHPIPPLPEEPKASGKIPHTERTFEIGGIVEPEVK